MKLWIVSPINDWKPWYDKAFCFVVRAATEDEARKLASDDSGAEGAAVWLDASMTSCSELSAEGEPEILCCDLRRA